MKLNNESRTTRGLPCAPPESAVSPSPSVHRGERQERPAIPVRLNANDGSGRKAVVGRRGRVKGYKRPPLKLIPYFPSRKLIQRIGTTRYVISEDGTVYSMLKPTITGWKVKKKSYNIVVDGVIRRYTQEEINNLLTLSK